MSYNLQEANTIAKDIANSAITKAEKITQLQSLISQLDITASGTITVLYSGDIDGTYSGNIVENMIGDGADVRVLDKTEASEFLSSKNNEFMNSLKNIFGDVPTERGTISNKFLFGENDISGNRTVNGAWDNISGRFAAETTGEVRILTTSASKSSVLLQTELLASLDNQKITTIDGIPRAELKALLDSDGIEAVKHNIIINSRLQIAISDIKVEDGSLKNVDTYIDLGPDDYHVHLEDPTTLNRVNQSLEALKNSDLEKWKAIGTTMSSSSKLLGRLGLIGGIASLLIMSTNAGAAVLDGNNDLAKKIALTWAADEAGAFSGGVAAGAIASIALGAAALLGIAASAPVAGAIILGASLIGSFYGADGATAMYNRFQYLDEAGKTEFLEQVSFVLFGDYNVSELPIPAGLLEGDRFSLDTTFDQATIVDNAKTSIAWRYALVHLNTFVIDGDDALYAQHNQNGELDLENFTESYLNDRAHMLSWRLKYDNSDQEYNTDWNSFAIKSDITFIDHTIKVSDGINTSPLTFRIDNLDITTTDDRQIIFGSDSDETLTGESLDDHIYGIAGENTLSGRGGNDYLEGGLISFLNQHKNSSNLAGRL